MSRRISINLEVTVEEGLVIMNALCQAAHRKLELEPEPEPEPEPTPTADTNGVSPFVLPKGSALLAWRIHHGLTQRDAAVLSGFKPGRWSRWERMPNRRVRLKAKDRDAFRQWWSHRPQE